MLQGFSIPPLKSAMISGAPRLQSGRLSFHLAGRLMAESVAKSAGKWRLFVVCLKQNAGMGHECAGLFVSWTQWMTEDASRVDCQQLVLNVCTA